MKKENPKRKRKYYKPRYIEGWFELLKTIRDEGPIDTEIIQSKIKTPNSTLYERLHWLVSWGIIKKVRTGEYVLYEYPEKAVQIKLAIDELKKKRKPVNISIIANWIGLPVNESFIKDAKEILKREGWEASTAPFVDEKDTFYKRTKKK